MVIRSISLIGTILLKIRRQVSYDEGEDIAKTYDMLFFEASALSSYNIENIFYNSASMIIDLINKGEIKLNDEVII